MAIKLLFLLIVTEGLVELWFEAAPVLWIKEHLIRFTPFLYSNSKGKHPFECEYCSSVWIAGFVSLCNYSFQFIETKSIFFHFLLWIFLHRGSNLWHELFSYVRDLQRDILVSRKRNNAT